MSTSTTDDSSGNESESYSESDSIKSSSKSNGKFEYFNKHKPKIQVFKGNGKDVLTIENWFELVDILGKKYDWNNKDKFTNILEFLEDEALNFYLDIRKQSSKRDWKDLKQRMIKRFGVKCVDPIIAFLELKYDEKKEWMNISMKSEDYQVYLVLLKNKVLL